MKYLLKLMTPIVVIAMLFTACTKEVAEVEKNELNQVPTEMTSGMDLTAEQIQTLQNARAEVPAELQEAIDRAIANTEASSAGKLLPPTDPCHYTTAEVGYTDFNISPSTVSGLCLSFDYVNYHVIVNGPGYTDTFHSNNAINYRSFTFDVPFQTGNWSMFVFAEVLKADCEDTWIFLHLDSQYIY